MLPLPEPARDGSIERLSDFLNVKIDSDEWRLIVAWLLAALRPLVHQRSISQSETSL